MVSLDGDTADRIVTPVVTIATVGMDREAYEDIDEDAIYSNLGDGATKTRTHHGLSVGVSPIHRHPSEEYLKPVDSSEILNGKPKPAPRILGRKAALEASLSNPDHYFMLYANTEVSLQKDRPALCVRDGFVKLSMLNVQTLVALSKEILAQFVPSKAEFRSDLSWTDFTLRGRQPMHTMPAGVSFYPAKNLKLKPRDCLLAVS